MIGEIVKYSWVMHLYHPARQIHLQNRVFWVPRGMPSGTPGQSSAFTASLCVTYSTNEKANFRYNLLQSLQNYVRCGPGSPAAEACGRGRLWERVPAGCERAWGDLAAGRALLGLALMPLKVNGWKYLSHGHKPWPCENTAPRLFPSPFRLPLPIHRNRPDPPVTPGGTPRFPLPSRPGAYGSASRSADGVGPPPPGQSHVLSR